MKKIITVLLAAVISFAVTIPAFATKAEILIDGNYDIVISTQELSVSAAKFADYIENICGDRLDIKNSAAEKPILSVGINNKTDNGYSIVCKGKNIEITGSDLSQTVRGMYAFLEKFGGVHCYTSSIIKYTQDYISVPADTNYRYSPFFEYTETDWLSPKDIQYSLFNGLNGGDYRNIPNEFGGTTDYISAFCHTLTSQFCSKEKYYTEHPEYFALYHGIRTDSQLCLTNPDVKEIVKNEVLDLLKEKYNPDAGLQIVSLTQADNIFFCTCPHCKNIDKKYGSHAGSMIEMANYVAKAVKDAGYSNVAIDTFAYQYTRTPPVGITLEDNVIVRLCSFECCFSHALDDSSCKSNQAFLKDLDGWSKICNRIYVWDYCTDFNNWTGIFPDFGTLGKNMQILYEHNVKGVYEEGNYKMKTDAEFGELRSYIISRLFVDPYADVDMLMQNFCNEYYGDGGKFIYDFLKQITENASEKHLCIYQSMRQTLNLSNKEVKQCDELWKKAKATATGDALDNIIHSEISWRWWKMKNRKSEFSSLFNYKAEKEKLIADIDAFGNIIISETDDEVRNFFVSLFWNLYVSKYSIVS
ncbi:MAG: DUF4838 domain-containing protein, partial [Ruminococcus sp.]|nr:DUF4838 domain-containing protein [Candidatus Copronaster equi]